MTHRRKTAKLIDSGITSVEDFADYYWTMYMGLIYVRARVYGYIIMTVERCMTVENEVAHN